MQEWRYMPLDSLEWH